MVLRKERPPCSVADASHNTMNNEQPESKRQRIDGLNGSYPDAATQDAVIILTNQLNGSTNDLIPCGKRNPIGGADEPDHVVLRILEANRVDIERPKPQIIANEWLPLQTGLMAQCLCDMSDEVLQRTFQSHYAAHESPANVVNSKHGAVPLTLSEWPYGKLIPFLSNLQILFDTYLKQSRLGKVCGRIKDICDALALSDEYMLISDIIELSDNPNKYVQYLAGRVVSTFLVVAQDRPAAVCDWLEKLVDYFPIDDKPLDKEAKHQIGFSMEVFLRILEWQDENMHPLDEDCEADIEEEILSPMQQPPIESNYFNFYSEYGETPVSVAVAETSCIGDATTASPPSVVDTSTSSSSSAASSNKSSSSLVDGSNYCQFAHLDDYYCQDTTQLKKDTVQCIETKWPPLFCAMKHLIDTHSPTTQHNENLILTFLDLWQKIISGAGGKEPFLSVTETDPFYEQLDIFQLRPDLPPRIYMQILALFNAVLCYGDSLALQDNLPEKTCRLAQNIIKQVSIVCEC